MPKHIKPKKKKKKKRKLSESMKLYWKNLKEENLINV
jgi:hypothetical protein